MGSRVINKVGFWAGIFAFIFTTAYSIIQILQILKVFIFPVDEILIYGVSLAIVIPFIFEMVALHYIVPQDKKIWSHGH